MAPTKKLENKLIKYFLVPLFIGILLSVCVTIVAIAIFTTNQTQNKSIVEILKKWEQQKVTSILMSVENMIFDFFTKSNLSLYILKNEYESNSNLKLSITKEEKIKFIDMYSYNGSKIDTKEVERDENKDIKVIWYIDTELTNLTQLSEDQLDAIYEVIQVTLLQNSIYMFGDDSDLSYKYKRIFNISYFNFEKLDLQISYPINIEDGYDNYEKMDNPLSCIVNGKIPNYYYFKCRPWYLSVKSFWNKYKDSIIAFSSPYKFLQNDNIGVTSCIKVVHKHNSNLNSILCQDLFTSQLFDTFDILNHKLKGKFHVNIVGFRVPLYYPRTDSSSSIEGLQFNLFDNYYIDEVEEFKLHSQNFTKDFNSIGDYDPYLNWNNTENGLNGIFKKNNILNSYRIIPIKFNIMKNETSQNFENTHIFSIVYIDDPNFYLNQKESFQINFYIKIILKLVLLSIFTIVLLFICYYLIITLSRQIVYPMINLKTVLKGMDSSKQLSNIDQKLDKKYSKKGSSFQSVTELNKKFSVNKPSNKKVKNDEYNQVGSDSNSENSDEDNHYNDDDNYIDKRSEEIEILFLILSKIKTVVSFTRSKVNSNSNALMTKYLFSKFTFQDFSNENGKYLCESNIGNLSIKYKMFDKAIYHLNNSLNDPINIITQIEGLSSLNPSKIRSKSKLHSFKLQTSHHQQSLLLFKKKSNKGSVFENILNSHKRKSTKASKKQVTE